MQYVGQTGRALKKRFGEHYLRMNKPKKIDNFLYRHFKRKGHTPANILVQPVEKITYDANSTSRFKIIKRHKTELKWIKLLQTPYPLGFNDNIYLEGNLSKMPDFDVFSLLEFRKRTARSHGIKKNGNCKRKSRVQTLANCTLRDLATKLDVHGRHCMLSYLSSLPVSVLRSLDTDISISPLRLHSASSVQIPSSTRKFNTMLPSIKIRPLNILSVSSVNLHGITNSNVFHNNLRIRLSPLK